MKIKSMELASVIMLAGLSVGSAHAGALAFSYANYSNFVFTGDTTFNPLASLTSSQSNAQYTGYTSQSGSDTLDAPTSCSGPNCPGLPPGYVTKTGSLAYGDAQIINVNIGTGGEAVNMAQSSTDAGGGTGPNDLFGAAAGSNSLNADFTMNSTGSVSISFNPDAKIEVHSWGPMDQASANLDFSVTLTNSLTGIVIDSWTPSALNLGLFQAGVHDAPNRYAYNTGLSWTSIPIDSSTQVSMNIQMGERSRFDVSSVPEIDAMAGTSALALLAGCFGLLADRRRLN